MKYNYKDKSGTKQWLNKNVLICFLNEWLIQSNEIDPEAKFQALGPENEKARSPKIMRSLGKCTVKLKQNENLYD